MLRTLSTGLKKYYFYSIEEVFKTETDDVRGED